MGTLVALLIIPRGGRDRSQTQNLAQGSAWESRLKVCDSPSTVFSLQAKEIWSPFPVLFSFMSCHTSELWPWRIQTGFDTPCRVFSGPVHQKVNSAAFCSSLTKKMPRRRLLWQLLGTNTRRWNLHSFKACCLLSSVLAYPCAGLSSNLAENGRICGFAGWAGILVPNVAKVRSEQYQDWT